MSIKEQGITRELSFDEFFLLFIEIHFQKDMVEEYLREKQSPYDYQTMCDFLHSEIVKNKLEESWDYERGEKWGDRSVDTAVIETIAHGLIAIEEQTEIYLMIDPLHYFPNLSEDEVLSIQAKVNTLLDYSYETIVYPPR